MKAGGIGINLHTANRVILFDENFNPSVTTQAVYRCYRIGQTKPVFVYRFQTQGTAETKMYRRAVNKIGVALNILDGKDVRRHFTDQQLANLTKHDVWVQCNLCKKYRMLRPTKEEEPELPENWFCDMNTRDPAHSSCDVQERDEAFYENHFRTEDGDVEASEPCPDVEVLSPLKVFSTNVEEKKRNKTREDKVLELLLSNSAVHSSICKYDFHEDLLDTSSTLWDERTAPVKDEPTGSSEHCEEDAIFVSSKQKTLRRETAVTTNYEAAVEGRSNKVPKVLFPKGRNAYSISHKPIKQQDGEDSIAVLASQHIRKKARIECIASTEESNTRRTTSLIPSRAKAPRLNRSLSSAGRALSNPIDLVDSDGDDLSRTRLF